MTAIPAGQDRYPAKMTSAERTRATQPLRPIAFIAGVLVLALVGGLVVLVTATRGTNNADLREGAPITTSVPTDFGFLTVPYIQKLGGLSAKQLAGAVHGVSGLVVAGNQQVQVTVELSSTEKSKVTNYRVDDFAMLAGDGSKVYAPTSTTIHNGTLQPNASVTGHFGFVVPKDGARLRLRYAPENGKSVLVELGHAGKAKPGEKEPVHQHG